MGVLMALLPIVGTQAQSRQLKGSVVDDKSGKVMPFANVALMRPADTVFMRGATTDLDGRFTIVDVAVGEYLIQVSYVGYHTSYMPYTVAASSPAESDLGQLRMKVRSMMKSVVVRAERPIYAMDGEKNIYSTKEDPSIQTGTASDALQNAPGVEVDAEGNITLRGVSGVEIWVNDRPSHMNEEALKQYIKQLPANAIERIEVITNPSARYSTNGGVINIVTNQKITRNELLCLGVQANSSPSATPWLSYVWANEKVDFNFYVNGVYKQQQLGSEGSSTLLDANGDTSRYQQYATQWQSKGQGAYGGFNVNWHLDSLTDLVAWLGVFPYGNSNYTTSQYQYFEYQPSLLSLGYADTNSEKQTGNGLFAGAWFEHRFDTTGRKLSANFNFNMWGNSKNGEQTRDYANVSIADFQRRTLVQARTPNASLGVDYVRPMKHNIDLEAGAEMIYMANPISQHLDSLSTAGTWDNIALRGFESTGHLLEPSAYLTVQKRWGNLTAKVGLRAEAVGISGDICHVGDAPTVVDTTFFGLVPSIHLSYRTKDFSSYSISYTRRYKAPEEILQLSTFRIYDDYSYNTGNPALRLSYAHNMEAAWNKYFAGFGNVGINAYFRANTDEVGNMTAVGYAPEYFGAMLVNYTYPDNIGSSHTEGIEANITYRPTGFLNVRLNASVFNYAYTYDGFSDSRVSWSGRINVWAKLWKRLEVFANVHYTSPRLGLYSLSVANKGCNLGVSSDFFDRKLSVNLSINDIFGWTEWGSNTTSPQYQTTGSQHLDNRFVSLGLTWRIGKMELEGKARQGNNSSMSPGM